MGTEVKIIEPSYHLYDEWMGIAVCVVFCSPSYHQIYDKYSLSFQLIMNGKEVSPAPVIEPIVGSSNHIWLLYLASTFYQGEDIISLWECDENGFNQIDIRIETTSGLEVKKCGCRIVYNKEIEHRKESSKSDQEG